MSVSGFSQSDSSFQTFLWVAAVLRAFFGRASIAAELSSAFSGSSSWVLLVPAADACLVAIFRGGGSSVPLLVVWAQYALVLCPSRPHLRQSASLVRCSWNSSSVVPFISGLKDSLGFLAPGIGHFCWAPVLQWLLWGPFLFPWPVRPSALALTSEPIPFPSLSGAERSAS